MSDIQTFRQAVETFISSRGWTPTRFGRTVAGDPLFVFDLREGREPRSDTRTRILKAMQDFGDGTALPPLRVGVAGLGNVGATLVSILQKDGAELTKKLGRQLIVTAVGARSRSRDRGIDISGLDWFDDPVALAKSEGIDLFVELIGGEDGPALASVKAALEIGRKLVAVCKGVEGLVMAAELVADPAEGHGDVAVDVVRGLRIIMRDKTVIGVLVPVPARFQSRNHVGAAPLGQGHAACFCFGNEALHRVGIV